MTEIMIRLVRIQDMLSHSRKKPPKSSEKGGDSLILDLGLRILDWDS
jgi:hypothetical protein